MGLLKKIKDVTEKGIEKSTELGTKGYDSAKDAAKRGYDKAREGDETTKVASQPTLTATSDGSSPEKPVAIEANVSHASGIDPELLKVLKMRYAKGEITKEQFEEMKKQLLE